MLDYVLLVTGLGLLLVGGDVLVKGAVGLAERLQVPALIIGLTIVAFGTSAPELFISIQAALAGAPGIAIGNVVGSNIANVLLVMGLPALIAASRCDDAGIGRNILVMIGFTAVFMIMLLDQLVSRVEGIILLILLLLFLYDQWCCAARANTDAAADIHEEVGETPSSMPLIFALLAIGLIALPFGANLTVESASAIARRWDVSEDVIGLTIVAIGTSLPELATTVMATLRSSNSIAIGNVVGSNIFNIGSIMGIAPIIAPMAASGRIVYVDMWVMLACALLLAGLAHWKIKIGKRVGTVMITAYTLYVAAAFVT
ncbi:calcium/sodium antiporter [Salaquimonas pukyongi]|uniref:calcium/sodium antiporter n=1 Tax=Salaquimonas pukyongi TaxID=2712698 RepID=UPI00096B7118|nr:calcium/sodium antiporter [Salaquimonas pukyongi]